MRTSTLLASTLALLSGASARIYGIAAPKQIAPDTTVKLEILGENYIQTVQDVAISFGIQNSNTTYPETLGTLLSSKYLGPDDSNVVGNITHYVHIPYGTTEGQKTLTGALFSLYGAVVSPTIEYFAVNVTVANSTIDSYVTSKQS